MLKKKKNSLTQGRSSYFERLAGSHTAQKYEGDPEIIFCIDHCPHRDKDCKGFCAEFDKQFKKVRNRRR